MAANSRVDGEAWGVQDHSGTRVGIVGTGVMGGHHTRIAAALPGCTLVGIFDTDAARAIHLAEQYRITAFHSLADLCAAVEAVIVATPAATHAEIAVDCLRSGCHVLLEKPLAVTVDEAERLAALHRTTDRVLMVGHIERFNPAVDALLSVLPPEEIIAGEAMRLSTTTGRDRSADVIFDLMIHDIDLALACTRSLPVQVEAMGHRVRGSQIDYAAALIRFASGATFTLTASMVSQERMRTLRVLTAAEQFTVDCGAREVRVLRSDAAVAKAPVEQLPVPAHDPLTREQQHFLEAIRAGSEPATGAEVGLQAVRIAGTIQAAIGEPLIVLGNAR